MNFERWSILVAMIIWWGAQSWVAAAYSLPWWAILIVGIPVGFVGTAAWTGYKPK